MTKKTYGKCPLRAIGLLVLALAAAMALTGCPNETEEETGDANVIKITGLTSHNGKSAKFNVMDAGDPTKLVGVGAEDTYAIANGELTIALKVASIGSGKTSENFTKTGSFMVQLVITEGSGDVMYIATITIKAGTTTVPFTDFKNPFDEEENEVPANTGPKSITITGLESSMNGKMAVFSFMGENQTPIATATVTIADGQAVFELKVPTEEGQAGEEDFTGSGMLVPMLMVMSLPPSGEGVPDMYTLKTMVITITEAATTIPFSDFQVFQIPASLPLE